jgi:sugar lactone lactonase YvrE
MKAANVLTPRLPPRHADVAAAAPAPGRLVRSRRSRPRLMPGFMQRSMVLVGIAALGAAAAACEGSGAANTERAAGAARADGAAIALPGDCRGAWWDARAGSLFVTDVTHDELIEWREGAGFRTVARLPPASSLGGVVRLADGRFVVSSFGFGEGAIYVIEGDRVRPLGGLDPGRRRTALALAPDGAVYAAYFEVAPRGVPRGGVARLELGRGGGGGGEGGEGGSEGGEADVVTAADLRKPEALAATEAALYVTDQHRAALYVAARDGAGPVTTAAPDVPDPALVAALPGGALIVVSRAGVVFRVPPGGPAVQIARGEGEVRGAAYDPARARLLLLEQRAGAPGAPRHVLHILEVAR